MNVSGLDLVALTCIGCFTTLVALGHDGAVLILLSTIVGYYFGKRTQDGKTTGQQTNQVES